MKISCVLLCCAGGDNSPEVNHYLRLSVRLLSTENMTWSVGERHHHPIFLGIPIVIHKYQTQAMFAMIPPDTMSPSFDLAT